MTQVLSISRKAADVRAPVLDLADAAITRLLDGYNLDQTSASELFERIVEGTLSEPLMSATFTALRVKGETTNELIGAAEA
ncbi:MAG TPA: hypothetical protein VFG41_04815, partial [Sphingomicrobium sp.]|nr:hypothetical protein [Sphingomicrobium sp.]